MDVPPIVQLVRDLDEECYLISEVAAALDVPVSTLRRWARKDPQQLGPSKRMTARGMVASLYVPADVRRLTAHVQIERDRHPSTLGRQGRPRMWTLAETVHRQTRYNEAYRLRKKAKALKLADPPKAKQANTRSRIVLRTLRSEAKARRAQLATRNFGCPE